MQHTGQGVAAPSPRPGPLLERVAGGSFLRFGSRLAVPPPLAPPQRLRPFEALEITCRARPGHRRATYSPALEAPRGAVLFLHPWLEFGQACCHRRGRFEAVRQAGYHALAVDQGGGFGRSAAPQGFFDRDVEEAKDALRASVPGLPLFVWGVSSGGYWTTRTSWRGSRAGGPRLWTTPRTWARSSARDATTSGALKRARTTA